MFILSEGVSPNIEPERSASQYCVWFAGSRQKAEPMQPAGTDTGPSSRECDQPPLAAIPSGSQAAQHAGSLVQQTPASVAPTTLASPGPTMPQSHLQHQQQFSQQNDHQSGLVLAESLMSFMDGGLTPTPPGQLGEAFGAHVHALRRSIQKNGTKKLSVHLSCAAPSMRVLTACT